MERNALGSTDRRSMTVRLGVVALATRVTRKSVFAENRTVNGVLGGFLGFVGMSAVAGVLVTAAVTPALALSGMAATNTIGQP